MDTFSFNEIQNKHNQRIYMFSKFPGNSEMEKCINFLKAIKESYNLSLITIDGNKINVLLQDGSFELFNDLEEKIGEYEDEDINIRTDVCELEDTIYDLIN